MLEFIEEALDEVAFAVEREIAKPLGFAVRFRRDDRSDFPLGQGGDKRIGVEGLVGIKASGLAASINSAARAKRTGLPPMWRRPLQTSSSITSTTRLSSTTVAPPLIRVRRTLIQRRVCRRRQVLELAWRRRRSPRKLPCLPPWPGRRQ